MVIVHLAPLSLQSEQERLSVSSYAEADHLASRGGAMRGGAMCRGGPEGGDDLVAGARMVYVAQAPSP